MEDIDELKHSIAQEPKYRLSDANVFVSPGGYHYIDFLDPVIEEDTESRLSSKDIRYIEEYLHSNIQRFGDQVNIVKSQVKVIDRNVLDIGCGGGLFLSKLALEGAIVTGIELNSARAEYAKSTNNLEIYRYTIESDYWKKGYANTFDVLTLWDVIEHVNYPLATLRASAYVLKSGGYIFIDTPYRDSFYHRVGEFTYRISKGRFPTFLNAMYSSRKYGHKQIFSTIEIENMLEKEGFEVLQLTKFHELSLPYMFYLKKLLGSECLARLLLPLVHVFLFVIPIKNKMLVIGRKK